MHEIAIILDRIEGGAAEVAGDLLPQLYDELRRLARAKMARESGQHTLQPTALVHEAWLRLGGDRQPAWQNRAHLFSAAAEAMRRILIDRARSRRASRHGGGLARAGDFTLERVPSPGNDAELLDVHDALDALARHSPRKAELVKLSYFAGLTRTEAANVLGISEPTARRDLVYARAWLYNEIRNRPRGHGV